MWALYDNRDGSHNRDNNYYVYSRIVMPQNLTVAHPYSVVTSQSLL